MTIPKELLKRLERLETEHAKHSSGGFLVVADHEATRLIRGGKVYEREPGEDFHAHLARVMDQPGRCRVIGSAALTPEEWEERAMKQQAETRAQQAELMASGSRR